MKTTLLLKLSILTVFSLFFNPIFSQEKHEEQIKSQLTFTESKILDDQYKVVYFCFSELKSSDHQAKIKAALESEAFVSTVRIYKDSHGDDRCQLTLKKDITAEKVRTVLTQNSTDFKFVSVSKSTKTK